MNRLLFLVKAQRHFLVSFKWQHGKVFAYLKFIIRVNGCCSWDKVNHPLSTLSVLNFEMEVVDLTTGEFFIWQMIVTQNGVVSFWQFVLFFLVFFFSFLIGTFPFELFAFILKIHDIFNFFEWISKKNIPINLHGIIIVLNRTQRHYNVREVRLWIVLFILHLIWTELLSETPNFWDISLSFLLCFLPECVPSRLRLRYLLLSANFKIGLKWFFERSSFLLLEKWLLDGFDIFIFLESKKFSEQFICLLHCLLLFFCLLFLFFILGVFLFLFPKFTFFFLRCLSRIYFWHSGFLGFQLFLFCFCYFWCFLVCLFWRFLLVLNFLFYSWLDFRNFFLFINYFQGFRFLLQFHLFYNRLNGNVFKLLLFLQKLWKFLLFLIVGVILLKGFLNCSRISFYNFSIEFEILGKVLDCSWEKFVLLALFGNFRDIKIFL